MLCECTQWVKVYVHCIIRFANNLQLFRALFQFWSIFQRGRVEFSLCSDRKVYAHLCPTTPAPNFDQQVHCFSTSKAGCSVVNVTEKLVFMAYLKRSCVEPILGELFLGLISVHNCALEHAFARGKQDGTFVFNTKTKSCSLSLVFLQWLGSWTETEQDNFCRDKWASRHFHFERSVLLHSHCKTPPWKFTRKHWDG